MAEAFQVDSEDLETVSNDGRGRMYMMPNHYQLAADNFRSKALFDDDLDGDGYSTVNEYLTYIEKQNGSGKEIAPFVLDHIRSNYRYVEDRELYGWVDWYAYPIETIAKGAGDCEDFVILSTALLHRAGYDCGILVFGNHALAVVAMEPVPVGDVGEGYSPFSVTHEGKTYCAFETTDDCPIGYVSTVYVPENVRGHSFF